MTAAERLAFYAAQFSVVEADSTYYRPPSPELTGGWAERSPDGFRMNVKAYSLMTGHPTKPETLWTDIREAIEPEAAGKANVYPTHLPDDALDAVWYRFGDAMKPLRDAGKLGAVLLQYPQWFTPKHDNREELAQALREAARRPAASWWSSGRRCGSARTTSTARSAGSPTTTSGSSSVDAPKVSKLPQGRRRTNADIAVVRFHGRADDTWKARTSSAAERFKYLYNKRQLSPWVKHVEELACRGQRGRTCCSTTATRTTASATLPSCATCWETPDTGMVTTSHVAALEAESIQIFREVVVRARARRCCCSPAARTRW